MFGAFRGGFSDELSPLFLFGDLARPFAILKGIRSEFLFTKHYSMKTSTIVWIIVVLVILAAGAWYWYSTTSVPAAPASAGGPSTSLGINGSLNQGNLGGSDTGSVQQPQ